MSKRYLLDTGTAFDCMFQRLGVHERVREARRRGAVIGICVPVLGEIIAGVEGSASRERTWNVVRHAVEKFVLWPYDKAAAYEFGRLAADLRRRGRPIQQVDVMIAAIAKTLGDCTIVTGDSDFEAVPGLKIENWAD